MLLKLFCGLFVCTAALAQDETVNLYFISFPKVDDPEPLELLIGEEETMEVDLPTNHVSKAYSVPALSKWVLGKSSMSDANGFTFKTFGQVTSINSKSQLVLVLRSGKGGAEGLELKILDYSEDGFGGGEYLFMNAAKVDIAGVVGEEKFAIKPGNNFLLAPKATKTRGNRGYSYARFYFRNKDEAQGFFSATWRLNDRSRSLVFFYHDPNTKQLRLHITRSFLSAE